MNLGNLDFDISDVEFMSINYLPLSAAADLVHFSLICALLQ